MPVIHNRTCKNGTFFSVDHRLKTAGSGLPDLFHHNRLIFIRRIDFSLFLTVKMCDDQSFIIHDKTVSHTADPDIFGNILYLVQCDIQGNDTVPVRKHICHRDHHRMGLRIHIRLHDHRLSRFFCRCNIPVSFFRHEIRRWLPAHAVQIFSADPAVDTVKVFIHLRLLFGRLLHQIGKDLLRRHAVIQHKLHSIRRDAKHIPPLLHITLDLGRFIGQTALPERFDRSDRCPVVGHHIKYAHKGQKQKHKKHCKKKLFPALLS